MTAQGAASLVLAALSSGVPRAYGISFCAEKRMAVGSENQKLMALGFRSQKFTAPAGQARGLLLWALSARAQLHPAASVTALEHWGWAPETL
jgi:hypothetical protein